MIGDITLAPDSYLAQQTTALCSAFYPVYARSHYLEVLQIDSLYGVD